MINVTVVITGLDETKARLSTLGSRLSDYTEALTTLGAQMMRFFSDTVFASQGSALEGLWVELKTATEVEKNKKWPGRGILQRTGYLQSSFYDDITPTSLFVSNNAQTPSGGSLFAIHQMGTAEGPGRGHNIPARPMIGVNGSVVGMIQTVIEADVRAKIEEAGGA